MKRDQPGVLTRLCGHPRHAIAMLAATAAVIHVVATAIWLVPAPSTVDEVVHQLMAQSFADRGWLHIANGYEELPSPELTMKFIEPVNGRLAPRYPPGFSVLVSPVYKLIGFHAFALVNSVAFAGTIILTYLLAMRLFRDRVIATAASSILAIGTYSWQYTQAIWPHATSTFLVVAAFYLGTASYRASLPHRSARLALCAGLVAGIAIATRLDSVFVIPAIWFPFVFSHPVRLREPLWIALGLAPALALLTLANHIKFGVALPFSYGELARGGASGVGAYRPILSAGMVLLTIAWCASRPRARIYSRRHPFFAGAGVAALLLLASLWPPSRQLLASFASAGYDLLVALPPESAHVDHSLKSALLQSCPYLVVLLAVPLWARSAPGDWSAGLVLSLVPLIYVGTYIGTYSYFHWDGGACFNIRYFLPALPFLSIGVATVLTAWVRALSARYRVGLCLGAAIAVPLTACVYFNASGSLVHPNEALYFQLPLWIAALLCALTLTRQWAGSVILRAEPLLGVATLCVALIALVYSALVAFHYDYRTDRSWRDIAHRTYAATADLIAPDSLLFSVGRNEFSRLVEKRVLLALMYRDKGHDFARLLAHHSQAGRRVYAALPPDIWKRVDGFGWMDGFHSRQLWFGHGIVLREIVSGDR